MGQSGEAGRRGESSPDELAAKSFASAGEAGFHGSHRPAELVSGLLMRLASEVAKNEGKAIRLGQAVQLDVDEGGDFGVGLRRSFRLARCKLGGVLFVLLSSDGGSSARGRDAVGDLGEPGAERVAHPECPSAADENEKRGLEGVVSVVFVAEHEPADTHDHGAVAIDKGAEGEFGGVAVSGGKPFEQLGIGQLGDRSAADENSDLPHNGVAGLLRHVLNLLACHIVMCGRGRVVSGFLVFGEEVWFGRVFNRRQRR